MYIFYGLLLFAIININAESCTIYDYPGCEATCLINGQNQINGELYRVNGKCYQALTNCYGCLSNPDAYVDALLPVPCDCSAAPDKTNYPGCLIYDWPTCEPNCVVNGQAQVQEQGAIYRVVSQCYQALTGCSGCLGNPDAYPDALEPVDCDCSTYDSARDCSILAIDDFLLECSNEFDTQTQTITELQNEISNVNADMITKTSANGNDIATLQSEVGTMKHEILTIEMNSNDIEDLANMIAQIEKNMTSGAGELSQQIITIETTIMDAVNERLDAFSAKAPNANIDTVSNGNNSSSLLSLKDLLIIGLLISNVCLMWCTYFHGSIRKKHDRKERYAVQFDEESDAEIVNEK